MGLDLIVDEQLAIARRIVSDGHEVVPAWRIGSPGGEWLLLTRFDHDAPGAVDRAFHLVRRFMAWRQATWFVQTAEIWLGDQITRRGDEAIVATAISRSACIASLQRIDRGPPVRFEAKQTLTRDQLDPAYFSMLPRGEVSFSVQEIAALEAIFGAEGELPASRLH